MIGLVALFASAAASAGTFTITSADETAVEVLYTGEVYDSDVYQWLVIAEAADGRPIILTIDSGGGSAYGGLDLYWALEAYDNLITKPGAYGAYSAAAIMWLAGDYRYVPEGTAVAFHAAYCMWDDGPNPDIGCNTAPFQTLLLDVFEDAGYYGVKFNVLLNEIQQLYGTDGWLVFLTDGEEALWDSTENDWIDFDADYLEKAP